MAGATSRLLTGSSKRPTSATRRSAIAGRAAIATLDIATLDEDALAGWIRLHTETRPGGLVSGRHHNLADTAAPVSRRVR